MVKVSKICQILLLVAFVCAFAPNSAYADSGMVCNDGKVLYSGKCCKYHPAAGKYTDCVDPIKTETKEDGTVTKTVDKNVAQTYDNTVRTDNTTPTKVTNTNSKASSGAVTGCSKDLGLFSGLINTGNKIFKGLRDLIYVVAGFGLIGVAVGGFFGNLNWKWLGAIIIALVVIATTGELINAITGCTEFTSSMITDTLK